MTYKDCLVGLFIILVCFACNKQDDDAKVEICTIENPLENISWLKDQHQTFEMMASPSGTQIIQYEYKEECVFWIDPCYDCADGLVTVYDAEQNVVCEFGSILGLDTCPDFAAEATNPVVLWDGVE